jgi:hypothetical protein
MSYSTGTASSSVDLLQKLVTWLNTTVGWNVDLSAASGLGWRAHLDLHGNFVHMRALLNEGAGAGFVSMNGTTGYALLLYMSTAFNGANAWNNQPGNPPVASGTSQVVGSAIGGLPSGAIQNYYFFSDATGDNIVVVVEKTPGVYAHFGWGPSIQKAGSFSNGQYFFGSTNGYWSVTDFSNSGGDGMNGTTLAPGKHGDGVNLQTTYVRVDVDAFTGKWIGIGDNAGPSFGYTGKNGGGSIPGVNANNHQEWAIYGPLSAVTPAWFYSIQTSALDGRANLLPPLLWVARDAGGYSLLGSLPNVFYSNGVGNGFSNAEEFTLGPTTYKMFPNFAVIKQ